MKAAVSFGAAVAVLAKRVRAKPPHASTHQCGGSDPIVTTTPLLRLAVSFSAAVLLLTAVHTVHTLSFSHAAVFVVVFSIVLAGAMAIHLSSKVRK